MKKTIAILSVLLILSLLCSTTAIAQTVPLIEPEGTQIELDELDATDTPDNGFVVTDDGEPVLTVDYVDAPGLTAALSDVSGNGFYTADFLLPDGSSEVFLTGLTRDNIDEIERAFAAGYADGSFTLSNLGFIDAEKTLDADADDNLCWAASSANILTYTGWAAQAGFRSEDDLFELFINNFQNKGGHAYYGVGWFFNGVKNTNPSSSMPIDYPSGGNYLSQYAYNEFTEIVSLADQGAAGVRKLYDRLRDGFGVALNVEIFDEGVSQGGHAISCWGFVTDNLYPETDKAHYKSVIVTDSDSYEHAGADRRDADDVMTCYPLIPLEQEGGADTYYFTFSNDQLGVLNDSVALRPYTASLPSETAGDATKDRRTSPDLMVNLFYLADTSTAQITQTKFAPGSSIYYRPHIQNAGSVNYNGDFTIKMKVVDRSTGTTVYTRSLPAGNQTIMPGQYLNFGSIKIPQTLGIGDYTITASVNDNHATAEAYFYNNSRDIDFKVRQTYLIGDVDGNGEVESVDVTAAMRVTSSIVSDPDPRLSERGDINADGGLDIIDVAFTQRYLASIPIPYAINTTGIYE